MKHDYSLMERLESLLTHKKGKRYYAEKLGISEGEVKELLSELHKKNKARNEAETAAYIGELEELLEINNEKGTLKSQKVLDFDPKDDLELAELHKIDLSKYKISNYWSKRNASGKFISSVFATLRKPDDYTLEDFSKFFDSYTPKDIIISKVDSSRPVDTVDIEVSIADFHLAKKTLEGETVQDKKLQYLGVLKDIVEKSRSSFNIRNIVFPISNDFFHTDNYQNQTTAGTPQDVLVEFDNEYEEGFDLLVTSINYLQAVCENLKVVLVQGNHDRTKSFYLAHALEIFFKNSDKISFLREHSTTKSVVLGNTFIGYHHGNCKIDELPLVFATSGDTSFDFGRSLFREIHTGDKHHYMAKEIKGVRIQQMPSLSGVDRWHRDYNFINNIRAGLALVYHPIYGKIAEFESRI